MDGKEGSFDTKARNKREGISEEEAQCQDIKNCDLFSIADPLYGYAANEKELAERNSEPTKIEKNYITDSQLLSHPSPFEKWDKECLTQGPGYRRFENNYFDGYEAKEVIDTWGNGYVGQEVYTDYRKGLKSGRWGEWLNREVTGRYDVNVKEVVSDIPGEEGLRVYVDDNRDGEFGEDELKIYLPPGVTADYITTVGDDGERIIELELGSIDLVEADKFTYGGWGPLLFPEEYGISVDPVESEMPDILGWGHILFPKAYEASSNSGEAITEESVPDEVKSEKVYISPDFSNFDRTLDIYARIDASRNIEVYEEIDKVLERWTEYNNGEREMANMFDNMYVDNLIGKDQVEGPWMEDVWGEDDPLTPWNENFVIVLDQGSSDPLVDKNRDQIIDNNNTEIDPSSGKVVFYAKHHPAMRLNSWAESVFFDGIQTPGAYLDYNGDDAADTPFYNTAFGTVGADGYFNARVFGVEDAAFWEGVDVVTGEELWTAAMENPDFIGHSVPSIDG